MWSVWGTAACFPIIADINQCQKCQSHLSLYSPKSLLVFFSFLENMKKFKEENKQKKHPQFHQSEIIQVIMLCIFFQLYLLVNILELSPIVAAILYAAFTQVLIVFINTLRAAAYYSYICSIILLTTSLFFYIYSHCNCFGIYYQVVF